MLQKVRVEEARLYDQAASCPHLPYTSTALTSFVKSHTAVTHLHQNMHPASPITQNTLSKYTPIPYYSV
jgi:hypothetical protein